MPEAAKALESQEGSHLAEQFFKRRLQKQAWLSKVDLSILLWACGIEKEVFIAYLNPSLGQALIDIKRNNPATEPIGLLLNKNDDKNPHWVEAVIKVDPNKTVTASLKDSIALNPHEAERLGIELKRALKEAYPEPEYTITEPQITGEPKQTQSKYWSTGYQALRNVVHDYKMFERKNDELQKLEQIPMGDLDKLHDFCYRTILENISLTEENIKQAGLEDDCWTEEKHSGDKLTPEYISSYLNHLRLKPNRASPLSLAELKTENEIEIQAAALVREYLDDIFPLYRNAETLTLDFEKIFNEKDDENTQKAKIQALIKALNTLEDVTQLDLRNIGAVPNPDYFISEMNWLIKPYSIKIQHAENCDLTLIATEGPYEEIAGNTLQNARDTNTPLLIKMKNEQPLDIIKNVDDLKDLDDRLATAEQNNTPLLIRMKPQNGEGMVYIYGDSGNGIWQWTSIPVFLLIKAQIDALFDYDGDQITLQHDDEKIKAAAGSLKKGHASIDHRFFVYGDPGNHNWGFNEVLPRPENRDSLLVSFAKGKELELKSGDEDFTPSLLTTIQASHSTAEHPLARSFQSIEARNKLNRDLQINIDPAEDPWIQLWKKRLHDPLAFCNTDQYVQRRISFGIGNHDYADLVNGVARMSGNYLHGMFRFLKANQELFEARPDDFPYRSFSLGEPKITLENLSKPEKGGLDPEEYARANSDYLSALIDELKTATYFPFKTIELNLNYFRPQDFNKIIELIQLTTNHPQLEKIKIVEHHNMKLEPAYFTLEQYELLAKTMNEHKTKCTIDIRINLEFLKKNNPTLLKAHYATLSIPARNLRESKAEKIKKLAAQALPVKDQLDEKAALAGDEKNVRAYKLANFKMNLNTDRNDQEEIQEQEEVQQQAEIQIQQEVQQEIQVQEQIQNDINVLSLADLDEKTIDRLTINKGEYLQDAGKQSTTLAMKLAPHLFKEKEYKDQLFWNKHLSYHQPDPDPNLPPDPNDLQNRSLPHSVQAITLAAFEKMRSVPQHFYSGINIDNLPLGFFVSQSEKGLVLRYKETELIPNRNHSPLTPSLSSRQDISELSWLGNLTTFIPHARDELVLKSDLVNTDELEEKLKDQARENRTPILIKTTANEFFVYGDPQDDNNWTFKKVEDAKVQDAKLKELFEDKDIETLSRDDPRFSDSLLQILKENHAQTYSDIEIASCLLNPNGGKPDVDNASYEILIKIMNGTNHVLSQKIQAKHQWCLSPPDGVFKNPKTFYTLLDLIYDQGCEALELLLDRLKQLHTQDKLLYESFQKAFIDDQYSIRDLLLPENLVCLQELSTLTDDTQKNWWKDLLAQQKTVVSQIDFAELFRGFQHFLTKFPAGYPLPTTCPLLGEGSENMLVGLDRLLAILSKVPSSHLEDQLGNLNGLSFDQEGAWYAARWNNFHYFHPAMNLRADLLKPQFEKEFLGRAELSYQVNYSHLKSLALSNQAKEACKADRMDLAYAASLFHRHLGGVSRLRNPYQEYVDLINTLNGNDLLLMGNIENTEQISSEILAEAKKNKTPILIKQNDGQLRLYCDPEGKGEWSFSPVIANSKHLKDLPFHEKILKSRDPLFTAPVLAALRKKHPDFQMNALQPRIFTLILPLLALSTTGERGCEKSLEYESLVQTLRDAQIEDSNKLEAILEDLVKTVEHWQTKPRLDELAATIKLLHKQTMDPKHVKDLKDLLKRAKTLKKQVEKKLPREADKITYKPHLDMIQYLDLIIEEINLQLAKRILTDDIKLKELNNLLDDLSKVIKADFKAEPANHPPIPDVVAAPNVVPAPDAAAPDAAAALPDAAAAAAAPDAAVPDAAPDAAAPDAAAPDAAAPDDEKKEEEKEEEKEAAVKPLPPQLSGLELISATVSKYSLKALALWNKHPIPIQATNFLQLYQAFHQLDQANIQYLLKIAATLKEPYEAEKADRLVESLKKLKESKEPVYLEAIRILSAIQLPSDLKDVGKQLEALPNLDNLLEAIKKIQEQDLSPEEVFSNLAESLNKCRFSLKEDFEASKLNLSKALSEEIMKANKELEKYGMEALDPEELLNKNADGIQEILNKIVADQNYTKAVKDNFIYPQIIKKLKGILFAQLTHHVDEFPALQVLRNPGFYPDPYPDKGHSEDQYTGAGSYCVKLREFSAELTPLFATLTDFHKKWPKFSIDFLINSPCRTLFNPQQIKDLMLAIKDLNSPSVPYSILEAIFSKKSYALKIDEALLANIINVIKLDIKLANFSLTERAQFIELITQMTDLDRVNDLVSFFEKNKAQPALLSSCLQLFIEHNKENSKNKEPALRTENDKALLEKINLLVEFDEKDISLETKIQLITQLHSKPQEFQSLIAKLPPNNRESFITIIVHSYLSSEENLKLFNDETIDKLKNLITDYPDFIPNLIKLYQETPYPSAYKLKAILENPSPDNLKQWLANYEFDPPGFRAEPKNEYAQFDTSTIADRIDQIQDVGRSGQKLFSSKRHSLAEDFYYVNGIGRQFSPSLVPDLKVAVKNLSKQQIRDLIGKYRSYMSDTNQTPEFRHQAKLEFAALLREVMYRSTGKFPYSTQMLSLLNVISHGGNIFSEIRTGEGKGCITALFAAMKWAEDGAVDVATSNMELAARDLEEFKGFYDYLGIPTALIKAGSDPSAYQQNGINYSDVPELANFQQKMELMHKKLPKKVSCIIDEADFTALDNTSQFRFAIQLEVGADPYTNPHEWVYPLILDFVRRKEFLTNLVDKKVDVHDLKVFLKQHPFMKSHHSYLKKLNSFSPALLDKWIDSAYIATQLVKDKDYAIRPATLMRYGEEKQVQIAMVKANGRVNPNSSFSDGVQQFLHTLLNEEQAKNKQAQALPFPIDPEKTYLAARSAKNFIDYYLKKGSVVGLTGTLGSTSEIKELSDNYKLKFFRIPPHRVLCRINHEPVLAYRRQQALVWRGKESAEAAHFRAILKQAKACQRSGQPLLIICDGVESSEKLHAYLAKKLKPLQLYNGEQDVREKEVVQRAGQSGMVTVSTAMLGRGTDIKPQGKTGIALGLAVIDTFIAPERDFGQTTGRTARNGARGETHLILSEDDFVKHNKAIPSTKAELKKEIENIRAELSNETMKDRKQRQYFSDVKDQFFNNYIATSKNIKTVVKESLPPLDKKQLKKDWKNIQKNNHRRWEAFLKAIDQEWNKLTTELSNQLNTDAKLNEDKLLKEKVESLASFANKEWKSTCKSIKADSTSMLQAYQSQAQAKDPDFKPNQPDIKIEAFQAEAFMKVLPNLPEELPFLNDDSSLDPTAFNEASVYLERSKNAKPEEEQKDEHIKEKEDRINQIKVAAFLHEIEYVYQNLFPSKQQQDYHSKLISCLNKLLNDYHRAYHSRDGILAQNHCQSLIKKLMQAVASHLAVDELLKEAIFEAYQDHLSKHRSEGSYVKDLLHDLESYRQLGAIPQNASLNSDQFFAVDLDLKKKSKKDLEKDLEKEPKKDLKKNLKETAWDSCYKYAQSEIKKYRSSLAVNKTDRLALLDELAKLIDSNAKGKNLSALIIDLNNYSMKVYERDLQHDQKLGKWNPLYRNRSGSRFQKMVSSIHDQALSSILAWPKLGFNSDIELTHLTKLLEHLLLRTELTQDPEVKKFAEDENLKTQLKILHSETRTLSEKLKALFLIDECLEVYKKRLPPSLFKNYFNDTHHKIQDFIKNEKHLEQLSQDKESEEKEREVYVGGLFELRQKIQAGLRSFIQQGGLSEDDLQRYQAPAHEDSLVRTVLLLIQNSLKQQFPDATEIDIRVDNFQGSDLEVIVSFKRKEQIQRLGFNINSLSNKAFISCDWPVILPLNEEEKVHERYPRPTKHGQAYLKGKDLTAGNIGRIFDTPDESEITPEFRNWARALFNETGMQQASKKNWGFDMMTLQMSLSKHTNKPVLDKTGELSVWLKDVLKDIPPEIQAIIVTYIKAVYWKANELTFENGELPQELVLALGNKTINKIMESHGELEGKSNLVDAMRTALREALKIELKHLIKEADLENLESFLEFINPLFNHQRNHLTILSEKMAELAKEIKKPGADQKLVLLYEEIKQAKIALFYDPLADHSALIEKIIRMQEQPAPKKFKLGLFGKFDSLTQKPSVKAQEEEPFFAKMSEDGRKKLNLVLAGKEQSSFISRYLNNAILSPQLIALGEEMKKEMIKIGGIFLKAAKDDPQFEDKQFDFSLYLKDFNEALFDEDGKFPQELEKLLPTKTAQALAAFLQKYFSTINAASFTDKGELQPWIIHQVGQRNFDRLIELHGKDLVCMQLAGGVNIALTELLAPPSGEIAKTAKDEAHLAFVKIANQLINLQTKATIPFYKALRELQALTKQRFTDDQLTSDIENCYSAYNCKKNELHNMTKFVFEMNNKISEFQARIDETYSKAMIKNEELVPAKVANPSLHTTEASLSKEQAFTYNKPNKYELTLTNQDNQQTHITLQESIKENTVVSQVTKVTGQLNTTLLMAKLAQKYFPDQRQATKFFSEKIKELRNKFGKIDENGLTTILKETNLLDQDSASQLAANLFKAYQQASEQAKPYQEGFSLSLLSLKDDVPLSEDEKLKAKNTNTPIMIKQGGKYRIYGNLNGEWEEKDITKELGNNVEVKDWLESAPFVKDKAVRPDKDDPFLRDHLLHKFLAKYHTIPQDNYYFPSDVYLRLAKHHVDTYLKLCNQKQDSYENLAEADKPQIIINHPCWDPHYVEAVMLYCSMLHLPKPSYDSSPGKGWQLEDITPQKAIAFRKFYEERYPQQIIKSVLEEKDAPQEAGKAQEAAAAAAATPAPSPRRFGG